jgi:hypothetical protein
MHWHQEWYENCCLNILETMVTLSSCEILDELRKLGIKTPTELIEFLEEYADYYTHTNIQLDKS